MTVWCPQLMSLNTLFSPREMSSIDKAFSLYNLLVAGWSSNAISGFMHSVACCPPHLAVWWWRRRWHRSRRRRRRRRIVSVMTMMMWWRRGWWRRGPLLCLRPNRQEYGHAQCGYRSERKNKDFLSSSPIHTRVNHLSSPHLT